MFKAITRRPKSGQSTGPGPLIALHAASCVYDSGAIVAIKDINLNIDAGDCVAILGASGSGKSSLINLLCGIDRPTSGQVRWMGREVSRRRAWARLRRSSIGIVFQDFNLLPTLTAIENVELALFGSGAFGARRRSRAADALHRVGLAARLHQPVTKLSGGERQRVAIARSIVNEPTLLLADEPTGNLDSVNAMQVADLLFGLREQTGMTLVLVTHDEQLASRCARQVRIRDGNFAASEAAQPVPVPGGVLA